MTKKKCIWIDMGPSWKDRYEALCNNKVFLTVPCDKICPFCGKEIKAVPH